MAACAGGIILISLVNLNSGILSINLPLDEVLQVFGDPDIEANLITDAGNLKR